MYYRINHSKTLVQFAVDTFDKEYSSSYIAISHMYETTILCVQVKHKIGLTIHEIAHTRSTSSWWCCMTRAKEVPSIAKWKEWETDGSKFISSSYKTQRHDNIPGCIINKCKHCSMYIHTLQL